MRGGISIGCIISLVILVGLAIFLVPILVSVHRGARENSCVSNQKQIALATMMYAQEHDEKMPATTDFWNAIEPYGISEKKLKCPEAGKKVMNSYGQNSSINGLKSDKIYTPETTFLTADARPDSNNIISVDNGDPRHNNKRLVASYVDGHVVSHKIDPIVYVHVNIQLASGLQLNKGIYTPDEKYNSTHWSLSKIGIDGDNTKVPADDKHSKLTYDGKTVTLLAEGNTASAVAKVDLPAFYPKGIDKASEYWVFNTGVSFQKSIHVKSKVLSTKTAIILSDDKDKVIAAFYALRVNQEKVMLREIIQLNYNNNLHFPDINDKATEPIISLRDDKTDLSYFNRLLEDGWLFSHSFAPLSIIAYKNTIYVTYDGHYNGKVTIDPKKANWKKPTTLKIVCFEGDWEDATNAIELQNPSFVIK